MRVLVTGGSGRLARHVFARAPERELSLRVLSRRRASPGERRAWAVGDLTNGTGLAAALDGVDAVLHLASDPQRSATDIEGTRRLVEFAAAAGVRHLLFLSIIGVDRIPYPYYRDKRAAEQLVEGGAVPWSIIRMAQFHSFVDWQLTRLGSKPFVMPVPRGFRVQSLDDGEAAERLIVALGEGPAGRLRDFAGPEIVAADEAADQWRRARGIRKPLLRLWLPGATAAAFREGHNTAPEGDRGRITWAEWLSSRRG